MVFPCKGILYWEFWGYLKYTYVTPTHLAGTIANHN